MENETTTEKISTMTARLSWIWNMIENNHLPKEKEEEASIVINKLSEAIHNLYFDIIKYKK